MRELPVNIAEAEKTPSPPALPRKCGGGGYVALRAFLSSCACKLWPCKQKGTREEVHPLPEIRKATYADILLLNRIAVGMQGYKEKGYFERCLKERRVFIAGEAGYVQLNMRPNYDGFRSRNIPEVQDLAVLSEFRNRGIGRSLVAHCENIVREEGGTLLGLGVGLTHSFGPAQRLYVKMGYIPDGLGIAYDDVPARSGEMKPVDDLLTLKMVKFLT